MTKKFQKEYEINYYDVDFNLNCKLSSIVNFLCDIGCAQSESLGETIEHLMENKCAWVFYKYDIHVNRFPKYREKISVETEAVGFNRFYAYRKYTITGENNEVLVNAYALFFLIDFEKRRPKRITKEQQDLYSGGEELPKNIDMEEVRDIDAEDHAKEFNIRYSDIDSNGHVNNVKYMEWAIESVPEEVIKDYTLKQIKVTFEKETSYGDKVHVAAKIIKEDEDIITVHTIGSIDKNIQLSKVEIKWSRE